MCKTVKQPQNLRECARSASVAWHEDFEQEGMGLSLLPLLPLFPRVQGKCGQKINRRNRGYASGDGRTRVNQVGRLAHETVG
jgi:hypothetical protein